MERRPREGPVLPPCPLHRGDSCQGPSSTFDLLTLSDLGHKKGLFTSVNREHVRILLARKHMLLAVPLSSWGSFGAGQADYKMPKSWETAQGRLFGELPLHSPKVCCDLLFPMIKDCLWCAEAGACLQRPYTTSLGRAHISSQR